MALASLSRSAVTGPIGVGSTQLAGCRGVLGGRERGEGLARGKGWVGGGCRGNPAAGAAPPRTARNQRSPCARSAPSSPSSPLLALSHTEAVAELQREKRKRETQAILSINISPDLERTKPPCDFDGGTTAEIRGGPP